jgi:hypothetical protein
MFLLLLSIALLLLKLKHGQMGSGGLGVGGNSVKVHAQVTNGSIQVSHFRPALRRRLGVRILNLAEHVLQCVQRAVVARYHLALQPRDAPELTLKQGHILRARRRAQRDGT